MEWTSDKLNEESPYFSSQRLFAVRKEGGGRRGEREKREYGREEGEEGRACKSEKVKRGRRSNGGKME